MLAAARTAICNLQLVPDFGVQNRDSAPVNHTQKEAHSVPDGSLVAGLVIGRKEDPGNGAGNGIRAVAVHRDVRERPAAL